MAEKTHAIIFVPGIFGTTLEFDDMQGRKENIWSPGIQDIFGYKRFALLSDPNNVNPGEVLNTIVTNAFYVYRPILKTLKEIFDTLNPHSQHDVVPAPYDWRVDLLDSARALNHQVNRYVTDETEFDAITFVAHSMGGLVTRLLLESVLNEPTQKRPWQSIRNRKAFFACTPHLGAPKALMYALGLQGDSTLTSAQCKNLLGNPNFHAGYQLLPSPDPQKCELILNTQSKQWISYADDDVREKLDLSKANIDERANLWSKFSAPSATDYFFAYGTG